MLVDRAAGDKERSRFCWHGGQRGETAMLGPLLHVPSPEEKDKKVMWAVVCLALVMSFVMMLLSLVFPY